MLASASWAFYPLKDTDHYTPTSYAENCKLLLAARMSSVRGRPFDPDDVDSSPVSSPVRSYFTDACNSG